MTTGPPLANRLAIAPLLRAGLLLALLAAGGRLPAQPAALGPDLAPRAVEALDDPEDDSGGIGLLHWRAPRARPPAGLELVAYRVYQAEGDGPFQGLLDRINPTTTQAEIDGFLTQLREKLLADLRAEAPSDPKGQADLRERRQAESVLIKAFESDPDPPPVEPAESQVESHLGLTRPLFEAPVEKLWTWRKYRFKVAALYAPPGRLWYMNGEPPPTPSDQPDAPKGPAVAAQEALSEVSHAVSPKAAEAGPWRAPEGEWTPYLRTQGRWYFTERTNVLIGCAAYVSIALWFIFHARRGREIYIRPIAGIEALDDAIGRATEMGKPILFVSGLSSLGDISTITAMTILGRVAQRTAEYETPLLVPCFDPLVMLAAREIVREAYLDAGKPEAYREQDIFFVTDRQFAYVAAVDGIMVRERPAANLYMGYFFAEALILAETGAATGAIQIAGTDADTQIPFFVTACDYTLMGEELYAATAYLSREPMLLAQLKAQDVGKAMVSGIMAVGAAAATVAALFLIGPPWMKAAATFITKCIDQLKAG